jgi:outer membrane protein TolC
LQGRSDIQSALAEYAAAEADLQLQIAKQYPDVHLSPGYQYDQGDNKWSLGVTFELPLLNQNQGPIAEARARRLESAARFTELQAKVIGEIDRASAAYPRRARTNRRH